jgi:quercetin 2,3-dioxygenase
LSAGETLTAALAAGRRGWLQVLRGRVSVNGQEMNAGDGVGVTDEPHLTVTASDMAELLWFDLD